VFNRLQRFWTSIKVAIDVVVLTLAFALAYLTRFDALTAPRPPWRETLVTLVLVLVLFPVTYRLSRLYATNRVRTHLEEVFELFKATITGSLVLVALTYFGRERYSRLTLVFFAAYSFVLVATTRVALRMWLESMRRRGLNLKSILLIGAGELGERVVETIDHHRELGFRVTGVLSRDPLPPGSSVGGVPVIGTADGLETALRDAPVDQVILALPSEDMPLIKALMDRLALHTVDVKIVPDLFQYVTLYGGLEEFGGLPIVSLQGGPLEGWNLVAKRAFDILFSALALLVVSPLMVIIAVAVKLSSRGPVLYTQERMGMDGAVFRILKFRTMGMDSERSGPRMASAEDDRRTALGGFLRRTSLDELPQLFNVLRGDMSLVGPRPERPVFIEEFKRQIPKYHLRHKVKSGITGWAQINGLRGQTSIQKRIEYDLYYIENWSLLLDLKILIRTALGGFLSRNAY
jgi:Undecaprenyl-phosphate glucose phosphotransferase